MARSGYCPSGRFFEAAACGTPIISDWFEGLDSFFKLGGEIAVVHDARQMLAVLEMPEHERNTMASRARERTLTEHSGERRAEQLLGYLGEARARKRSAETRCIGTGDGIMIGIIPAAGAGQRIQPLGCSKELLPVGSRVIDGVERPKAVMEYLVERMIAAGADQICMVISGEKTDIVRYFAERNYAAEIFYAIQNQPRGLCDALFRAEPFARDHREVLIGLPDTIWFPENAFRTSLDLHPRADVNLFVFR